jgi:hypothetical protein
VGHSVFMDVCVYVVVTVAMTMLLRDFGSCGIMYVTKDSSVITGGQTTSFVDHF